MGFSSRRHEAEGEAAAKLDVREERVGLSIDDVVQTYRSSHPDSWPWNG